MYNDELLASGEVVEKMNTEFKRSEEICEVSHLRQLAELDEIYELLFKCESLLKWVENKDVGNAEFLKKLIDDTANDKITALSCGCRRSLDYRYCCDKDFNRNCCDYCKCEMELIDKIIKILTLKNSIADKQCMIKLLKSRMDILQHFFCVYAK